MITNINFIKKFPVFLTVSLIIGLSGIIIAFVMGVRIDIQFSGGTIINYSYEGEIDTVKVAETVRTSVDAESDVIETEDITGTTNFRITFAGTRHLEIEEQDKLTHDLQEAFPDSNVKLGQVASVSASSGMSFFVKCLVAILFAFIMLVIYIGFRFKKIGGWSAGLCSIIALLNEILIVFSITAIFGFTIGDTFMAVALTIAGYSLNDSIIVFDRIRENRTTYQDKMSIEEYTNLSINQCLWRNINTSITTISVMTIVVIVAAIFGVTAILAFGIPFIVGLAMGAFSSLCFAAPLWVRMQKRH